MSLLSLPVELRLRIYDYLPDLQPERCVAVSATSKLTPSICRVNQSIRAETIPIYAGASFTIQIDNGGNSWSDRIACLLNALSTLSISKIRGLSISRHWSISQPERWQGHVGFYVRIERRITKEISSQSTVASDSSPARSFRPEWNERFVRPMTEGNWEVTTGTYPVARDLRGMRLDSADLLAEAVRRHLHVANPATSASLHNLHSGLQRSDIDFLFHAIETVATHPIPTFVGEREESARRCREVWTSLQQQLGALNVDTPQVTASTWAASLPIFAST